MKDFEYAIPKSVAQATEAMEVPNAFAKGGGTDLLDLMKGYVVEPDRLVHLMQIPELRTIELKGSEIHIGATVTIAELAANLKIPAILREAAFETATPQIRTTGTVGGNLCQRPRCWYFRDADYPCLKKKGPTCFSQEGENKYHAIFDNKPCAIVHPSNLGTALIAMEAQVITDKRTIDIAEFFVLPGDRLYQENVLKPKELVTKVVIKNPSANSAYREIREKQSFDWALVAAGVTLTLESGKVVAARIGLGSVSPVPRRAEAAEKSLIGQKVNEKLAAKAAELALVGATPMTHNAYKVPLAKTIVKRTILAAAGLPEIGGR
jgi:xanthine dehydrogenase YagS FAD-binding subunit